jgi:hypothetical protein
MLGPGMPYPMVLIAVADDVAFYRITQQRIAVQKCIEELQNIGCFVPNLSYFKRQQLRTDESNVVHTVVRLCRAHQDVI